MQLKRFVAADMRRALALVKEELGDDAMIMSTQRTSRGIELVASTEMPAEEAPSKPIQAFNEQTHQANVPAVPERVPTFEGFKPQAAIGAASGKTREQLANELEQARERMLASKRAESMTLGELAADDKAFAALSGIQTPAEPAAVTNHKTAQVSAHQATIAADFSTEKLEQRIEALISSNLGKQNEITEAISEKADREIRLLQEEIISMRSLFQDQLAAMANQQQQQFVAQQTEKEVLPLVQNARQRLHNLGLSQAATDKVISTLKSLDSQTMSAEGLWKESLARLSHQIKIDHSDAVMQGGVFAFWGPTGVGKTTTIAKLAARFVIEKGNKDVVLLTTDRYRIAAHEQLKSLASILGVKVKVVEDLAQLPKIIQQLSKQALVLIDTPGMSRKDAIYKEHLLAMRRCQTAKNILVLSANTQYQMMQSCIHTYRALNIDTAIFTKLDECASLGDCLSLLATNRLTLSYVTDGQSVPDDIDQPKPHQLVSRAVTLAQAYFRRDSDSMRETV